MRSLRRSTTCALIPLVPSTALFISASWAGAAPAVPLKTGNLSVDHHFRHATGARLEPPPPADPLLEKLPELRAAGVEGVEDYVAWLVVEPASGKWDWKLPLQNIAACRKAGVRYAIYPWLHFVPKWFESSRDYVPYRCLEHGEAGRQLSLWAPAAPAVYRRLYAAFRRHLGDAVSEVYIGMPADYGEVGYPAAMTQWLYPEPHAHPGFWCGDPHARADFQAWAEKRHGSIAGVNAAWGASFKAVRDIDFPRELLDFARSPEELGAAGRRRRLDFLNWYAAAPVRFAAEALKAVRASFPDRPVEFKCGYGSEDPRYGADATAMFRLAAREKNVRIRSTHAGLSYFHARRFGSPAAFYKVPLLFEPPGDVQPDAALNRFFFDASVGAAAVFDYPRNIARHRDLYARYRALPRPGETGRTPCAVFYPTSDQRLRGQEYPGRLLLGLNHMRPFSDYDLVDEPMIADGALAGHSLLIWYEGVFVEEATAKAVAEWIRQGGTLLLCEARPIQAVDGSPVLTDDIPPARVARVPIDEKDPGPALAEAARRTAEAMKGWGLPEWAYAVATDQDRLLTTVFRDRLVVLNPTDRDASVEVGQGRRPVPAGSIAEIPVVFARPEGE